jgi:O-antigen/teichoic acid export membrane protein
MTWLQRILGVVLAAVFLLAALVFASVALGVMLAVGLVVWGWLWWRTRGKLPRDTRPGHGVVIEGEFEDLTPQRIRRGTERNP